MDEVELCQSFVQQEQKNQFLDDKFKYQNCPHCQRNFFIGKLKYHLKLCKPTNPMIKSPLKKAKRSYLSTAIEKKQYEFEQPNGLSSISSRSPENKYKKCSYCKATFPLSAIQKHSDKCNLRPKLQANPEQMNKIKSKTKINFEFKKEIKEPLSALPRIHNSARNQKHIQRKFASQDLKEFKSEYTVKIRQELSCFKKALEVQQIECQYCHRRFSKQASLRHIPICQKIKIQQMQQAALKKHSKSQIYKLSLPIKKSTLFRSKLLGNSSEKNDQLDIKSARVYESQKIDRQKINNTSLVIKKQQRKERRLSDLKPLVIKDGQSYPINPRIEENYVQKNIFKESVIDEMNMTFSKNINGLSVGYGFCKQPQNNEQQHEETTLFNQQISVTSTNQALQIKSSISNQTQIKKLIPKKLETQGVENEFLEVTISKKKFFAQITFDDHDKFFIKKLSHQKIEKQEIQLEKIKLQIDLKDIQTNKKQKQQEDQDKYDQDFEE